MTGPQLCRINTLIFYRYVLFSKYSELNLGLKWLNSWWGSMAANTQMPPLSSPNTCTAQAEEAQHRGSGIWKTRLSVEVGMKEDTDVCSTAILTAVQHGLPSPALKPCFLVGLASQSGHQLLGMLWQLMALAQSPGCVLIPAGTLQQPRMKWGTAGAGGDPV